jgi:hypothetical protein
MKRGWLGIAATGLFSVSLMVAAQTTSGDGKAATSWASLKSQRSDESVQAAPAGRARVFVEPVRGRRVGANRALWVHVFNAKGGNGGGGNGGGGGGKPKPTLDCTDGNVTNPANLHGWSLPASTAWTYNSNTTPSDILIAPGSSIIATFQDAAASWDATTSGLGLSITEVDRGGFTGPAADGDHLIGFAQFTGRGAKQILAAAWSWVDQTTGEVTDTDIFFNTSHSWAVNDGGLTGSALCGDPDRFDIGNVFTHEVGHPVGVGHSDDANDSGRRATMAPTASKGEVRKTTLSDYDRNGMDALYGP